MLYREQEIGEKMKNDTIFIAGAMLITGIYGVVGLYLSGYVLEDPVEIFRCGIAGVVSLLIFFFMVHMYYFSKVVEKYGNQKQD